MMTGLEQLLIDKTQLGKIKWSFANGRYESKISGGYIHIRKDCLTIMTDSIYHYTLLYNGYPVSVLGNAAFATLELHIKHNMAQGEIEHTERRQEELRKDLMKL